VTESTPELASGLRLHRVAGLEPRSAAADAGGPLWFPRPFQGVGRHDNPALYGCLYCALEPLSAVVEALAPFRGAGRLHASMLTRMGRPLSLVSLSLETGAAADLVDLDDPRVLARAKLRPSGVATRERAPTQALAERFWAAGASGLRWWSTLEAAWINLTLFDRCAPALTVTDVRELALEDPAVLEAAVFLGLRAPA
jgi:hypothetical protein